MWKLNTAESVAQALAEGLRSGDIVLDRTTGDASEDLAREGERLLLAHQYDHAQECFEKAYVGRPELLMMSQARILAARARVQQTDKGVRLDILQAIRLLDEVLKLRPDFERAYYNRACYKSLADYSPEQVCEDISKAIQISRQKGGKAFLQELPEMGTVDTFGS